MKRIIDFMNRTRISLYILLALTTGLLLCAVLRQPNDDKRKVTLELMMAGLNNMHYSPLNIDDTLSDRVYTMYMKRLDSKNFFTQEDMAQIKQYEFKIDDEIKAGTFEFYDMVNSLYNKRIAEDSNYTKEVLAKPFDFKVDENIQLDPAKTDYAKDLTALKDQWRRYLKYQVMVRLADMMNTQEKAQEKKDTSVKVQTYAEMEKEARNRVLKASENGFSDYAKVTGTQRLSRFLDCIANAYDPHTEYFAPEERKNFDITLSGQLEGIGAQLQDKSGNITIVRVIPGSPAWKSGEIKEGDVIVKVAQATGAPVDIQGMQIDKAIELIRGKKGTEVKLTLKKPDNTFKVVTLIRDVIHLDDTYAHDAVIQEDGKKIGYIRLPEFYTNFDGTGSRTCAGDVKQELLELKAAGVQGIIMDLRDNGGGSLQDVVKMVGLFIQKGPVVQVRGRDQRPQMLSDYDTSVIYSGPLLVLVNGASASASEIFAAAIQDYKRGVIMGSQTYGKGTVQQMFNLDEYVASQYKDLGPLGSVKITISKFYRINGSTTQKDGVTPDIYAPDVYQYVYEKEKDSEYPIKADKINPAPYTYWNDQPDLSKLQTDFEQRTENDSIFQLIREDAQQYKKEHDNTLYSLNLDVYRKKQNALTETNKKYDAITKTLPGAIILTPDGKPEAKAYNEGKKDDPSLLKDPNTYAVYAIGEEAQKMKADTNEVNSEDVRLKRITKDAELFQATKVVNEMK